MRRFLLYTIILSTVALSAPEEITEENYEDMKGGSLENRLAGYTTMSVLGYTATAVGIGLVIGGFVATGKDEVGVDSKPGGVSFHADDKEDLSGPIRLLVGFPIGIGGAVLGTIGLKKARAAKDMLDAVNVSYTPERGEVRIRIVSHF